MTPDDPEVQLNMKTIPSPRHGSAKSPLKETDDSRQAPVDEP